ncbi:MAG: OmpA family protein [Muribaculaceae bacterium]|nr:OmpA family protein [Muribaculaceae bacterium]
MKTRGRYRTRVYEGDSCSVREGRSYEQRLIEDHPQHLIEDHPQGLIENHNVEAAAPAAVMAEPSRSSGWWAWLVAGLLCLCIIGAGFYFGFRNDNRDAGYANTMPKKQVELSGAKSLTGTFGLGVKGLANSLPTEYVYYFGNDKSAVPSNAVLDQVADNVEETGADVVVSAFASKTGNTSYNKALSEKRANNVANYLIAHGVPKSHVKVVPYGASTAFGDDAHNRRANIHVEYPG